MNPTLFLDIFIGICVCRVFFPRKVKITLPSPYQEYEDVPRQNGLTALQKKWIETLTPQRAGFNLWLYCQALEDCAPSAKAIHDNVIAVFRTRGIACPDYYGGKWLAEQAGEAFLMRALHANEVDANKAT